jgi:hypothetical protein
MSEYEEREDFDEDVEEYEEREYDEDYGEDKQRIDLGPAFRQFTGDKNSFAKIHYGSPTVNGIALSTFIEKDFPGLSKTQQRIAKASRSDEEIFGEALLVCAKLAGQSEKSITELFNLIPKLDKIKYKNPLLLMIAYLSIDRQTKKVNMDIIQNTLQDEYVKKQIRDVDIIRYIRYLLPYLNEKEDIDNLCKEKISIDEKEK